MVDNVDVSVDVEMLSALNEDDAVVDGVDAIDAVTHKDVIKMTLN